MEKKETPNIGVFGRFTFISLTLGIGVPRIGASASLTNHYTLRSHKALC